MANNLRVVLDTNALLVSVSEYSKYHWLYQSLIRNDYELAITNEILSEYEEKISEKLNAVTAESVVRTLVELENVLPIVPYYKFQLIVNDADDDKFADCAIVSNANYLVTNDKDFNILKNLDFPKVNVITINEFKEILLKEKSN
ncbi:MAG: putative toxin-antitoxin system toxin component, PIN family [Bacteroidota bacterium]